MLHEFFGIVSWLDVCSLFCSHHALALISALSYCSPRGRFRVWTRGTAFLAPRSISRTVYSDLRSAPYPAPRLSYLNGRPNPVARGKPMRASRATGRWCLLPLPRRRRPKLRRPLRRLVSLKVGLSLSTGFFKIRMASDASRCGVGVSHRGP